MTVEYIFAAILLVYAVKILYFRIGAERASKPVEKEHSPFVSIIVAARDEEHNIGTCIEALSRIEYPQDRMEIIIMNDQSEDRTADIIHEWEAKMPHLVYMETEGKIYGLRGKANAVTQAIERSKGEIILTSDADCQVQPGWVRDTIRQYSDDVGCVCGYTLIKPEGAFSIMQFLDWTYLMTVGAAGVGWNNPLSAVGNNMSFRRTAYEDVGGYREVGFSVTEDFVLFKAIGLKSQWKVRYPADPKTVVWSEPLRSIKEIYSQKKRWGKGGLEISVYGYAIMAAGFLTNVAIIASPFLGINMLWWGVGLAVRMALDTWFLSYMLRKIGMLSKLVYLPLFEIYFHIYVTLLPFIATMTGKVTWKGRKF